MSAASTIVWMFRLDLKSVEMSLDAADTSVRATSSSDNRHMGRRAFKISAGLLVAACIAGAQPPRKLVLHQRIERQAGPGYKEVFVIDVPTGQFVNVVLEKRGADVVLSVLDPSRKALVTADSPNFTFGRASAAWIAQASGTYSLTVAKSERSKETGAYEIEWAELRDSTDKDRTRIQALDKLYSAASKDRPQAIHLYEESAELWRSLGEGYEESLCLHRIGALYYDSGDPQKALDYYQRALAIRRTIGDRAGEANTLNNIGLAYARLGDLQKALDYYQQALPVRRAAGDKSGEASTLTNIAVAYSALGEQQKALEYCQQTAEVRRAAKDRVGEALALSNIAGIYSASGEQQKALDAIEQVLALYRAAGDRPGEARTVSSLGSLYRDLGAEEKALDFYGKALLLARAAADRSVESDTVIGMGDAYFFLGEKQKSLDSYQQGAAIKRALNDRSGEALALIGIANVYSDLGGRQKPAVASAEEKQKALDIYLQSLALGRAAGDFSVQVFALMGAGVAYSAAGDKQKAAQNLSQALFLFSAARYRPGEGWAQYEMARVERDRGNLTQARTLAGKALDTVEVLRTKVLSQDLRSSFFAAVQDGYALEMDILMRMHKADPSQNHAAEAFTVSERARARVLLESLGESRADIRAGVEAPLLERERTLQVQLNAKEMARMQMVAAKHTPEQLADLEKAVRDLASKYEDTHTEIRARSPRYAALNFPQPLSPGEIQKEVLDSDTLLLEFALGDQGSFLWAVSTSGIVSIALPKKSEIEQAARLYHDALIDPVGNAPIDTGKALSRMLLGEVASGLESKRLLIVADGALQYIPFAALPDPNRPEQPLIVNHEIVSAPSASTLAVLRRENADRKPAPKMLAVLADPVFSADDPRIARGRTGALQRSIGDPLAGMRLARLPGTRREAAGILSLVPESQRKQSLDFDASRATLTSPEMREYRFLHLATHGLLNTTHPELSGVALSLVDRTGKSQDGFVRLHEVYNLQLSADLVVLSACQTGLGKEIQGEGLVGLTRGFMYAGAPRVLASLWKVDDRATAELMKSFYGVMFGDKHQRPAAALRDAQIAMWRTKGWEAPYYWAAFVLQGDWK
jgi:CHAT domain-containing protein